MWRRNIHFQVLNIKMLCFLVVSVTSLPFILFFFSVPRRVIVHTCPFHINLSLQIIQSSSSSPTNLRPTSSILIKLLIIPPNPFPIPQPPFTPQIRPHPLQPLHPLIQRPNPRPLPTSPQPAHRLRKRKRHAIQPLPEHQIRVRELPTIQPFPTAARFAAQHVFEVGEEFGEAGGGVVVRAGFGGGFLGGVEGGDGDGVVGVVGFV